MAFHAKLNVDGDTATIDLDGELDAHAAPVFRARVEEAATGDLRQLVLHMEDLSYLSSAGLRGLVFAKQKMGDEVQILVVGPSKSVADTIRMTGFDQSVIMQHVGAE